MATKVVGLDLGAHTIKCCELVTTFRNFELVAFGSEPVERSFGEGDPLLLDLEARAQAAYRLLERRSLLSEAITVSLPAQLSSAVNLSFPFSNPKKVAQVLPFELAEALPFDLEDIVYDYQVIESRVDPVTKQDQGCTVLVSFVKTDIFEAFLSALSAAGIDPKVVTTGPLAWQNLYETMLASGSTGPTAVLDLGHTRAELTILERAGLRMVREFPGGGESITQALSEVFRVNLEQAERGKIAEGAVGDAAAQLSVSKNEPQRVQLIREACEGALQPVVRELRRSLAAFETQRGEPVTRLLLTGGSSQLRGLGPYLSKTLGLPVELFDATRANFNRLAAGGEGTRAYLGKPLALSLRAFARSRSRQINFRQGEYAYTGDFGFMRGRIIMVASAVLAIIVLAALGSKTREWVLQAEYQSLIAQVQATSEEVLGYENEDAEFLLTTIHNGVSNQNQLPETSAFEVLAEISRELDFSLQIDLDRYEIDIERSKLTLEGKTGSGGDVERIVDGLRKTRCFNSRVSKERVEKSVDDRTKFRLSATSSCT